MVVLSVVQNMLEGLGKTELCFLVSSGQLRDNGCGQSIISQKEAALGVDMEVGQ